MKGCRLEVGESEEDWGTRSVLNLEGCLFEVINGEGWGSCVYGGGSVESRRKDDGFSPISRRIVGGDRDKSTKADEVHEPNRID